MVELMVLAFSDELLKPYVEEVGANATAEGYWAWENLKEEQKELSANYVYVQHMILDTLLSIVCFRVSVRRNNYPGKPFLSNHSIIT